MSSGSGGNPYPYGHGAERILEAYYFDLERIDYVIAIKTEDIEKLTESRRRIEALIQQYEERLSDDN